MCGATTSRCTSLTPARGCGIGSHRRPACHWRRAPQSSPWLGGWRTVTCLCYTRRPQPSCTRTTRSVTQKMFLPKSQLTLCFAGSPPRHIRLRRRGREVARLQTLAAAPQLRWPPARPQAPQVHPLMWRWYGCLQREDTVTQMKCLSTLLLLVVEVSSKL